MFIFFMIAQVNEFFSTHLLISIDSSRAKAFSSFTDLSLISSFAFANRKKNLIKFIEVIIETS